MRRFLCSLLLIACLLAGLIQPVFGTESEISATETTAPQSESTEATEAERETEMQSEPTEAAEAERESETQAEPTEATEAMQNSEAQPAETEQNSTRAPQRFTTSAEGIAFVNEMMGGSYGGTYQLSNAEQTVNSFISAYALSLNQQQFDALVDLVMAYGSTILTSGYRVERVIGGGNYTEVELANAFCAWVKGADGNFSQQRLNRRLREIKLFLYGSYSGACYAGFRYVVFYPNGGTLDDNTVLCYPYGGTYSNLPTASRSGKYFAGWYTASSGGTHLCNSDAVSQNNTVYAHWSDSAVEKPNEARGDDPTPPEPLPTPPVLKTSEAGVQFIKEHEGFVKYAIWDYSQYSIGYGSRCDPADYPDGITEEEADYLLRVMLADFEKVVDNLLKKSNVQHTQAQYDAIISFTYNLGQQWMSEKYTIYQYVLYGGYDEMSFVNTIGSWCRAGGSVVAGLSRRRMDEANLYLNGDYTQGTKKYLCISFNGSKGEPEYAFRYYKTGEALGTLPTAKRDGYKLLGWYDKLEGGKQYTVQTLAPSYGTYTLYAQWVEHSGSPSRFTDVSENAWYYEWVMRAAELNLFGGVSATEFAPESPMTRAMIATVLYRMAGSPAVSTRAPFTDVPADQWYSDAIAWAYACGIVNGTTETEYGLSENVTREQLATMLYRYAVFHGYNVSSLAQLSAFADAPSVAEYAKTPMQWAVANNIIGGDNGKLLPNGSATRAQCAKMISVFFDAFVAAG